MTKKEIRKLFKQKRSSLSEAERDTLSQQIANQLLELLGEGHEHVSVFLPIERLLEIDTWKIIDVSKFNFYLPKVEEGKLKHIKYESRQQLKVSEWGIPEPTFGDEVKPELFDIVLVPLLAVDYEGNRVGYGAGFYDGFLNACRKDCKFIGLSFFEPIEKIDDLHGDDIGLDLCVTPLGVINFSSH